MHNLRILVAVAAILSIASTACTTTTERTSRGGARSAIRVDVSADGVPELYGDRLSISNLAKRLKREGKTRAVALHGAEGCTRASLTNLQRELVTLGVANVSIVTARRAIVEVEEDESEPLLDGLPPVPQTVPRTAPLFPETRTR